MTDRRDEMEEHIWPDLSDLLEQEELDSHCRKNSPGYLKPVKRFPGFTVVGLSTAISAEAGNNVTKSEVQ